MSRKVKGLNGREYSWSLNKYQVYDDDEKQRSELHLRCRKLLKENCPLYPILEEVVLPGSGGLSADFFIPQLDLMVEVNGEQHYTFNSYYFNTKWDWYRYLLNDYRKKDWCKLNDITLIELKYNETDSQWLNQLTNCLKK